MTRKRSAVLISGRGSNMQALVAAAARPDYPASIDLVISNRADAAGLAYAAERGIATRVIAHQDYASREAFDMTLDAVLAAADIEIVCLAGFMRVLTPGFLEDWRDRIINIHPSLLPAYKGLDTHARALADGVKTHGCSVHFVRADLDAGPVITQAEVRVLKGDTEETLAARVLAAEHLIYPMALKWLAEDAIRVAGDAVVFG